jgi:autotransporter adhesin
VATGSVAVGAVAMAALGNTAVGDGATANISAGSSAYGQNAVASATNSTALGTGAVASGTNSVAVGANSVASQANTVSFGTPGNERRLTNVAAGVAPTDAVNLGQLDTAVNAAVNAAFGGQINSVRNEERKGIAASVSMPPMVTPSAPGKFTIAVGAGGFQGQAGVGVTAAYRLPTAMPAYISGSYANGGGNESTFRVMGAVEF